MSDRSEPSPRAQAILRAIEHEANARRAAEPGDAWVSTGLATATRPLPAVEQSADRLMRLVDHVVAQTEGVRTRVKEVERSLDLLARELAAAAELEPAVPAHDTYEPGPVEIAPAVIDLTAEPDLPPPAPPPEPVIEVHEPVIESPEPVVEAQAPVIEAERSLDAVPPIDHSDAARLMAVEMAVSGSSRGEVGDRLVNDFQVDNAGPILDDVFGAGSPEDSRMPWST